MSEQVSKCPLRIIVVISALSLCACGGSSSDTTVSPDTNTAPLQDDVAGSDNTQMQCDAGDDFDIAELVYTETDRQWFCSVSSTAAELSDEVYFSRDGTATFSRFGLVYWNRDIEVQEIRIASPFVSTSVLRNVFSANTVLQFDLNSGDTLDEFYDCVLTQRDATRL